MKLVGKVSDFSENHLIFSSPFRKDLIIERESRVPNEGKQIAEINKWYFPMNTSHSKLL